MAKPFQVSRPKPWFTLEINDNKEEDDKAEADLIAIFYDNAFRILPAGKVDKACSRLMDLDSVGDVTTII